MADYMKGGCLAPFFISSCSRCVLCGHAIGSSALGQWGIGKNIMLRKRK